MMQESFSNSTGKTRKDCVGPKIVVKRFENYRQSFGRDSQYRFLLLYTQVVSNSKILFE